MDLLPVLGQMINRLDDPDEHFTVWANYYDHLTPGRVGERWHIAQIWFSTHTNSKVELTAEGLVLL